jgi:O-succinylbenzoate synthase
MFSAAYQKHQLIFKFPGGTSRGILTEKDTYYLRIRDVSKNASGIGECSTIPGLSPDFKPNYEEVLADLCKRLSRCQSLAECVALSANYSDFPSISFGLETALMDLKTGGEKILFQSPFTTAEMGIPINGLIWMGSGKFMREQIEKKLTTGYNCLKMKIGAIDFKEELNILKDIRKNYTNEALSIRVDANGAFSFKEAQTNLKRLAELQLHSIEQPIQAGNWDEMAHLCASSPLPIALDEELIGIHQVKEKERLINHIQPQYLILKPSLLGGFGQSKEWIDMAKKNKTDWWITSALESNIGLNAIAQWTSTLQNSLPQGLGTGQLYINNIDSPLRIENGKLFYRKHHLWGNSIIK